MKWCLFASTEAAKGTSAVENIEISTDALVTNYRVLDFEESLAIGSLQLAVHVRLVWDRNTVLSNFLEVATCVEEKLS